MRWPGIENIYGPTLRSTDVFGTGSEKHWEDLHIRVIEHVRIVSHPSFPSLILISKSFRSEYSCRRAVLHSHHIEALDVVTRPHSTAD